ncbi:hypothetical protein M9H77_30300 [Catharanthus roseus]|uniref:Uncharacterized protein n=1 Tax=Catharanthus roseus TaxID=4058 RepID=A0ACB9ZWU6_CATRO|nr:hypothetical protein M9H77_30300 [Catharanthus roseus]
MAIVQKIYNAVTKIKKNRKQGRNTVEEVLCLSAKRGYTIFCRNRENSNYNMPLLEVVGMTLTSKNFTEATAFMVNEQATTYRWVLQQIKHLYLLNAMSTENQEDVCDHVPKNVLAKLTELTKDEEVASRHLALKKMWYEIPRATGIYDDPKNKCGYYLRTSHGLSHACELIIRFDYVLPIQLSDIEAFWKTLEIGSRHLSARQQDMDSEMRSLTDLLH